jgi:hypothetical protein
MRNRLLVPAVTAGLLLIVTTAVTAAAAGSARHTAGSVVPTAVTPDSARAVVLINGDRIMAGTGRRSVAVMAAGAGPGGSRLATSRPRAHRRGLRR